MQTDGVPRVERNDNEDSDVRTARDEEARTVDAQGVRWGDQQFSCSDKKKNKRTLFSIFASLAATGAACVPLSLSTSPSGVRRHSKPSLPQYIRIIGAFVANMSSDLANIPDQLATLDAQFKDLQDAIADNAKQLQQEFEIRLASQATRLDDQYARHITGSNEEILISLFHAALQHHLQQEITMLKPTMLSASFAMARELEERHAALVQSFQQRPPFSHSGGMRRGPPKGDDDSTPLTAEDLVVTADISSLNNFAGLQPPQSLRLMGRAGTQDARVLIDGGSTHNFIHPEVVAKLQLPITVVPPFRVYVGNGDAMPCMSQCVGVCLLMQTHLFLVDLFVLQIHGQDLVLGVQWLQQLSKVAQDFAQLTLEFTWEGNLVQLRGGTTPKQVFFSMFKALSTGQQVVAYYEMLPLLLDSHAKPGG
ncbi:unnamed protein product [Cuscuta campestris]|uniref:Retrotransposon gag domain-containing protein n=1 Tax=Cuscuta campestris TaxID=132261 RepID=A0A484LGP4_9ASTE|nr:unnamed protein product [Cuscuta campestris]